MLLEAKTSEIIIGFITLYLLEWRDKRSFQCGFCAVQLEVELLVEFELGIPPLYVNLPFRDISNNIYSEWNTADVQVD